MKNLINILNDNLPCMLVTVISGKGSIPRKNGAYMLVNGRGVIYGTIGGGNLEYTAEKEAKRLLKLNKSRLYHYSLSDKEGTEIGMICGGSAEVLFNYADKKIIVDFERPFCLMLPVDEGCDIAIEYDGNFENKSIVNYNNSKYYCYHYSNQDNVHIFGGGHIAKEVVPLLSHLGFNCLVYDDREKFVDIEDFKGAAEVNIVDYSNINVNIKSGDYVLIMTRGHMADAEVERYVLNTEAMYIGVIGSKRKAEYIRNKLAEEGFSEAELNRAVSPVGIDIGSETPAEIAVSIAAQLIEKRAKNKQ